jgi:hypothetical protein
MPNIGREKAMLGSFSEKTTFYCDFTEEEFKELCRMIRRAISEDPKNYQTGTAFFTDLLGNFEMMLKNSYEKKGLSF